MSLVDILTCTIFYNQNDPSEYSSRGDPSHSIILFSSETNALVSHLNFEGIYEHT